MDRKRVLFCNSLHHECSVHNMGTNLYRVLSGSTRFDYEICTLSNQTQLLLDIVKHRPDVVFVNHMEYDDFLKGRFKNKLLTKEA